MSIGRLPGAPGHCPPATAKMVKEIVEENIGGKVLEPSVDHKEAMGQAAKACWFGYSMCQTSRLVRPQMLVDVEY